MQSHTSHLTVAQRQLVQIMKQVHYGRVESVAIVNGKPDLTHHRLVYELRVAETREPTSSRAESFTLKRAVTSLFDLFSRVGDGWVDWIEIRAGLPVRLAIVEGAARARQETTLGPDRRVE